MNKMATMSIARLVSFVVFVSCLLKLSASERVEWKINLGGEPTNGFQAEEAILDVGENLAKMRYHGQIKGTGSDLNVFKTQRFSRAEDLVLNFPVPDGVYAVTLMFAETWKGAYGSGNRVFDVYLGSKPGGIVKVIDQMDPFRSGGPAGPVRRKFNAIATQGGLTLALRPIKQNPQIAGIIISGYSYSKAYMEDLPVVTAGALEGVDFSALNNIGPRTPADPSLIYDPSLNPKFKASNKPSSSVGIPPQPFAARAPGVNPDSSTGTPAQSSGALGLPSGAPGQSTGALGQTTGVLGQSAGTIGQNAVPNPYGTSQSVQNINGASAAPPMTPGISSPYSNAPYGAAPQGGLGASGALPSSQTQAAGRPAPVAVGTAPYGAPQAYSQYRSFRRRLASYYGEGAPVNFPFTSNEGTGDGDSFQTQAVGDHSGQVGMSPMMAQGNPQDGFNGNFQKPANAEDGAAQAAGYNEVGHENRGELSPPNTGEALPLSAESEASKNDNEGSRGEPSSEIPREQEQAYAQKETFPQAPISPIPPYSDSQAPANIRDVHQDAPGPIAHSESLMPEATVTNVEQERVVAQEHALPERKDATRPFTNSEGLGREATSTKIEQDTAITPEHILPDPAINPYGRSFSRNAPNMASTTRNYDPREIQLGTASLQRGRGEVREGPYSNEQSSQEQNGSPKDFMVGIRDQIQSLIRNSRSPNGVQEDVLNNAQGVQGDIDSNAQAHALIDSQRTFRPVERVGGRFGTAKLLDEGHGSGFDSRKRSDGNPPPSNSVSEKVSELGSFRDTHSSQRRRVSGFEGGKSRPKLRGESLRADYRGFLRSSGTSDEMFSRQKRSHQRLRNMGSRQISGDIPGLPDTDPSGNSEEDSGISEVPPSAGVHIGDGILDGICIDNSTHCSCGMVNDPAEECLYIAKEDVEPMLCVRRACSGKLICACAPGASSLCERSVVRNILVPATVHKHGQREDSDIVPCRRENLEHGINVLTPAV